MFDAMKMFNIILDSKKSTMMCFLCLKKYNETYSIYSELEVIGDCFSFNLSLAQIMKKMLPSHEILFHQACEDCSNLILKMFMMLHRHKCQIIKFNSFIENFNQKLQEINPMDMKSVFIRSNIAETELLIEPKCDESDNFNTKHFDCPKCDMKFNSKDLMLEHKMTLHKNSFESTVCDVCGQAFKNSGSLRAHGNCHRLKECPYCFKILKAHSHFNVHLRNHKTNVKKKWKRNFFRCSSCNYETLNKNTLEAHINKVHLQIRPYGCDICRKGFYKKSNLTEHYNTHSQVKNKTCDVCGGHFVNDKTLMEHMRLHTGSKPYECNVCGKKFVTSGRRLEHVKRTHMEKRECCLYCDKRFSTRKELNRHTMKCRTGNHLMMNNSFDNNLTNYKFADDSVLPII